MPGCQASFARMKKFNCLAAGREEEGGGGGGRGGGRGVRANLSLNPPPPPPYACVRDHLYSKCVTYSYPLS